MAGLLHDVVGDCVETNAEAAQMLEKIGAKFGADVADIVAGVTETKRDEHDVIVPSPVRRTLYLERLKAATDRDVVWARFSGGTPAVVPWYRQNSREVAGPNHRTSPGAAGHVSPQPMG